MTKFDEVTDRFGPVKFMGAKQAAWLRRLIRKQELHDLLEIGFYQGKSSAYLAAILEDRGGPGRLTTIDRRGALNHAPNIHDLLRDLGLAHRVEPVFAFRSFTWELQRLLSQEPRPQFDFCYFDGGHTWDETGFGFTLVNLLLRPGGYILFDDIDWSVAGSVSYRRKPRQSARFGPDEAEAPTVRRVWDLLLPALGYDRLEEVKAFRWALARKPPAAAPAAAIRPAPPQGIARSLARRIGLGGPPR